jgi:hypothetical protein
VTIQDWGSVGEMVGAVVDRDIFETYERRTLLILTRPLALEWWNENSFRFSEDYRAYVDELAARKREGG